MASISGSAPAHDGLPTPRRYWAMLTIWLAMTLSVLDGSIANVALPTIAHDLNASAASSIWIVNAYQLAIVVTLLPLASLGDRVGYHRIYMVGLVVFTLGSLACTFSQNLTELAAARVVQGFGASGIMSVNPALVRHIYPHRMLGRGIGYNALVVAVSSALGPSIASLILGIAHWQWLFAVNVPLGVVTIAIAAFALPRTEGSKAPFDYVSAILNALTFGFLIFGVESLARDGVVSGLIKLAIGAAAGVALARRELTRAAPLVPFDLLRIPLFSLSIATSIVSFAAQMLTYVSLPFFLEFQMGRSVVATGLLMTPWPIAIGLSAPVSGHLADRYPAAILSGIGLAILSLGLVSLSLLHPAASNLDIVWRMAICGVGFGFFQSPNNRAMLTSTPVQRSGAAGGMLATARLLGQTSGALIMAILFQVLGRHAPLTAPLVGASLAGAGAVISLSRLKLAPTARPATKAGA